MNRKEMIQEKFDELRKQAEALMAKKKVVSPAVDIHDPLELIHELQTFQIELELQNEELQRSQQELMEFKMRYTELYDFTPVGYVCLDIKGVILNANLTLANMLSEERSSLIDQALSGYVHFEDQDIYYRHLTDLAGSKKRQICELRMNRSDGTILDVQLESTVFSYQSWRPEQYRTVIIDIAERKQMEKEREALRLKLHQSHKMESIRTIAGGIAHDFNNILFIINGNVELAVEETRDWHPAYPKLEKIRTATVRAAEIVKLLLGFSQTSDGEQTPMDLVCVIKDALILLRASIPTSIDIHTKFPDRAVMILSDKIQIGQILMNLCTNASQAMEKTGGLLEIRVETRVLPKGAVDGCPAGNYAEITVKDNGPGIDPGILDRIFDPYFTTREVGKGSGLGLAAVYTIVKNHKGTITVQNRPEGGALFTMLFPMVEQKPETTIKSMYESLHGTERILFIDDEENITQMALESLKLFDYRVEAMSDPEDALAVFTLNPGYFDVVITDMTMPKMTGARLAEKLINIRPDIPIVLCTGYSSLIDEKKARQLGIAAYMMKPVPMSEIAKTIRKLMDQKNKGAK
ncbi:MAG: response regulator [Desulfotignum sp.]|nr:response regulator [Desulfotignum sp.]MCF8126798.1 response regulator [Desulfotignum sp.]